MEIMRSTLLYLSKNRTANRMAKLHGLRLGAERFVAGETLTAAVGKVQELKAAGIEATLDHLGEFVASREEAEEAAQEVVNAVTAIAASGIRPNVSVKLTQLGLNLSETECLANMQSIVGEAKFHGGFVRIDMEDYAHNEPAIRIFEQLHGEHGGEHVGLVLQAYLRKTEDDMKQLEHLAPNYRLVKGAYKEPPEVAFPEKSEVDENFIRLIHMQLEHGHYAAVATHDDRIIDHVKSYTAEKGIPRGAFEFQMLYGIRPQLQRDLAREGYRMRVYVPYGTDWYGYFMRRLAERPENVSFVLKSMFKR